jgi:hypothetical protein
MFRLGRRIDRLIAAGLAVLAGGAGSQLLAFVQQYQQRLGGHLDEAGLFQQRILALAGGDGGERLVAAAAARVAELQWAADAIAGAGPFAKPFVVLGHLDRAIAAGTLSDFQPALPLDPASLGYTAGGAAVALIAYGALRSVLTRRPATGVPETGRSG